MPATFVPRAVSPLHFEPIQPDSDEVLCLGSDVEETPDQRKAKRRRIEEAGVQYLRGKSLYIASARLKGPFTGRWKMSKLNTVKENSALRVKAQQNPIWGQRPVERPSREYPIEISSGESSSQAETTGVQSRRPKSVENNRVDVDAASLRVTSGRDGMGSRDSFATTKSDTYKGLQQANQTKGAGPRAHGWLRTGGALLNSEPKDRHMSPTPTPTTRPRRKTPKQVSRWSPQTAFVRPCSELRSVVSGPEARNFERSILPQEGVIAESNLQLDPVVKEAELHNLDLTNEAAHKNAKKLSPQAAEQAQHDQHAHLEAKRLSQLAVSRALGDPATVEEPSDHIARHASTVGRDTHPRGPKRSPRALPPSTNLPEFEYRCVPRKPSKSPERKSFKEDLEAAKRKARAEQKRRLSFTASGSVRSRSPRTSSHGSRASRVSHSGSSYRVSQPGPSKPSASETKKAAFSLIAQESQETTSGRNDALPEAQIVKEPALAKVPSGPSTELIETDKHTLKFPSTDEGDSYTGLSTQGAMLKAQLAFHNNMISPASEGHESPPPSKYGDDVNRADNGIKGRRFLIEGHHQSSGSSESKIRVPVRDDEEHMSTQAMIDALSPFVATTVKKRRSVVSRPELTPSRSGSSSPMSPGLRDFRTKSLSMSTSPSPPLIPTTDDRPIALSALPKPPSSLTSFSIAPNGTMTEVFQQDGQQQEDYVMGDLDLNAAIEEAGSFLGDWSVEKEARNLERSTAGSMTSTAKRSKLLSSH
ncbi:MAG: hypothetical protein Q9181_003525 [Wetmoreana brouardii]